MGQVEELRLPCPIPQAAGLLADQFALAIAQGASISAGVAASFLSGIMVSQTNPDWALAYYRTAEGHTPPEEWARALANIGPVFTERVLIAEKHSCSLR